MNSSPARAEAPCLTPPSQKTTRLELLLHPLTPALPMSLQADAALQDFLQKREFMARTILKVDHELTEKEEQTESNFGAGEMPLPGEGLSRHGGTVVLGGLGLISRL